LLVFSLGNIRAIVQRNALFWESPNYAIVFGLTAGTTSAVLVQLASRLALHSPYSALALTLLGLFALAYIGYGVSKDPLFQDRAHQLELAARGAAASTYLALSALILGWALLHHWYAPF